MKYDRFKHHRRSIRLKGYDYAQAGAYFVTICLQGGQCLLGQIVDDEMIVNAAGKMIYQEWFDLPERFKTIELDAFLVMPNHVHGIIVIHNPPVGAGLVPALGLEQRAPTRGAPTNFAPTSVDAGRPTLGDIIGAFKSITTNKYITGVREQNWPTFNKRLWQRNYYEQIIRNERAYMAIQTYIYNNPANWPKDQLHPTKPKHKNPVE